MPLTRRGALRACFALAAGCGAQTICPSFAWAETSRSGSAPLFFIARSKNANVVMYDYLPRAKGDPSLDVYWRMHAERGQREELTDFERKHAYGYKLEREDRRLLLRLQALPDRALDIEQRDGRPLALTEIEGKRGALERVFVETREGFLKPRVLYVDLFGRDPVTGTKLRERIER